MISCVGEGGNFTLQEALGQRALLRCSAVTWKWSLSQGSCTPEAALTLKDSREQEADMISTGAELWSELQMLLYGMQAKLMLKARKAQVLIIYLQCREPHLSLIYIC